MNTLVVADRSELAEEVVGFGGLIVGHGNQPISVLAIARKPSDRKRVESILKKAESLLKPSMPGLRSILRVGHTMTEIINEINEGEYELVILGDRPPNNLFKRLFGGSLPLRIVEEVSCAVVIAKGDLRLPRKILICDSGGEDAAVLSEFVLRLLDLSELKEDVTILHVMSQISAWPGVKGQHLRADAEALIQENTPEGQILERDMAFLDQPMIHPHPKIRHGIVVDEILEEAKEGDYDLVIIGAHRREGWGGILLEDIAKKIILQIDRPVLVVPYK